MIGETQADSHSLDEESQRLCQESGPIASFARIGAPILNRIETMDAITLIGFAEALSAPEVVWSLVNAGFVVHAFARRGRRSALRHSRHVSVTDVTAPEEDAASAIRDVESLIRSFIPSVAPHPVVLFPLDDAAVWLCGKVSKKTSFALAGPTGDAVALALDKFIQLEVARSAGFRVPPTTVARTVEDVRRGGQACPLILKPAHAVSLVGSRLQKGGTLDLCRPKGIGFGPQGLG